MFVYYFKLRRKFVLFNEGYSYLLVSYDWKDSTYSGASLITKTLLFVSILYEEGAFIFISTIISAFQGTLRIKEKAYRRENASGNAAIRGHVTWHSCLQTCATQFTANQTMTANQSSPSRPVSVRKLLTSTGIRSQPTVSLITNCK